MCLLTLRCELRNGICQHTGLFEISDIDYNENTSMIMYFITFDGLYFRYYEENKVLSVLDNQTYYKILPLMIDKNINRSEKIEILRENSPLTLCGSREFKTVLNVG